jgi:hypothetical protein
MVNHRYVSRIVHALHLLTSSRLAIDRLVESPSEESHRYSRSHE